MTHRLKCEKRRKLSDVDGGKLRPSETSDRKHSGELDVQPRQEIKKGSRQRRRGTKRFVKMRIAARAHYPVYFPHASTCSLVLIVMLSIIANVEGRSKKWTLYERYKREFD